MPKFPASLTSELKRRSTAAKVVRQVAKYIASEMYGYTTHVSKDEHERVAQKVIHEYPHLRGPNKDKPHARVGILKQTILLYAFLGAATGSPYIVFIWTSGV